MILPHWPRIMSVAMEEPYHLKEYEGACVHAFFDGDKQKAERLLPYTRAPSLVRTTFRSIRGGLNFIYITTYPSITCLTASPSSLLGMERNFYYINYSVQLRCKFARRSGKHSASLRCLQRPTGHSEILP